MKEKLIDLLKTLRLRGMAAALDDSLTALSQKKLAPTSWLEQLLHAEIADRQARSYQYQLRLANFPMPRDLDSFDFKGTAVNETQIRQLYTGEYLTTARNIVFVGGTGTGKTHLATALARQVVLKGMRARFYSVVDLVNQLDAEKRAGRAGKLHDNCSTRCDRARRGSATCRSRTTRRRAAVPSDQQALRRRRVADRRRPI